MERRPVRAAVSRQSGEEAFRRRQLVLAFAWLGGWWAFTLALGWTILGGSFAAPVNLQPLAALASLLF